jgi:hypothetical protein
LHEEFATRAATRIGAAEWVDDYYTIRRHSSGGMISPAAFEAGQHQGKRHENDQRAPSGQGRGSGSPLINAA